MMVGRSSIGAAFVSCARALGCTRAADDLREWKPSDHRHTSESKSEADPEAPQVTGSAEPPLPGLDEVTIATWRRACVTCHGQLGRGDGPQGPMVRARDLSDSAWQAATSAAQMKESITKGRGKMPPFSLPAATLEGLVQLIRLFDPERRAQAAASARAASEGTQKGAPAGAASAAPRKAAAQAHDAPAPRAANGNGR
jgi:cytochrome c oxidase cbb3-type subunit 3